MRPELPVHEIDHLIKAELPSNNATLRTKIAKYMTHNRNHLSREISRCRRGTHCIYGFPHPISSETTVKDDGRVQYKRSTEEDRWIAPHIPELIDELDCHIFVDVVFTVSIFTYLYKYLYKGPDHTAFHIPQHQGHPVDEIKDYIDGRYLSAHEAAWRILGFHITSKTPSVTSLPVHLPDQNVPRYSGRSTTEHQNASLLLRYFNRPDGPEFTNLTYCEYFKQFVQYNWSVGDVLLPTDFLERNVLHGSCQKVRRRQVGTKVARIHMVSPTAGELFYLRCLLAHKPAESFTDLRTVDGVTWETFHEAAMRVGLFTNQNEGQYVLIDATLSFCTPFALRFLFGRVILEGYPALPLWEQFRYDLARDFIISTRSEERGIDMALQAISDNVHDGGRSLKQFGLPEPLRRSPEVVIEQETYSSRSHELRDAAQHCFQRMNIEQKETYSIVVDAATDYAYAGRLNEKPFFLEGKPGRGKTFVVDSICCQLRAQNLIVLVVGSSALAATLYEGGRTAHNLFQIPVVEVSTFHENHKRKPDDFAHL